MQSGLAFMGADGSTLTAHCQFKQDQPDIARILSEAGGGGAAGFAKDSGAPAIAI